MRARLSALVLATLMPACGERPAPAVVDVANTRDATVDATPPRPDDRRVSTIPDPSALAWNGAAEREVCWTDAGRLICHALDTQCKIGDARTAPLEAQPVRTLASENRHACAVMMSGALRCWGDNTDLVLGAEDPGPVRLATRAIDVSAGFDHTCALLMNGTLQCWGDNATAQLGIAAIPSDAGVPRFLAADPARVIKLGAPALQVSAGGGNTCALLHDGDVRCWGDTRGLKLGHELDLDAALTTRVALDGPAKRIHAGTWTTCAVLRDGRVQCWGENEYGQLCDAGPPRTTAVTIPLPAKAIDVAVDEQRGCAVLEDGRVACWGGTCQAKSCDPRHARPTQGKCTPTFLPAGPKPARKVILSYRTICQRGDDAPPSCTCVPHDP